MVNIKQLLNGVEWDNHEELLRPSFVVSLLTALSQSKDFNFQVKR